MLADRNRESKSINDDIGFADPPALIVYDVYMPGMRRLAAIGIPATVVVIAIGVYYVIIGHRGGVISLLVGLCGAIGWIIVIPLRAAGASFELCHPAARVAATQPPWTTK